MNKKSLILWLISNSEKIYSLFFIAISSIMPAYAAYASPWMQQYSPLSWILVGLFGLLIGSFIIYLLSIAFEKFIIAKRTSEILERSQINPLDDQFIKKSIRLFDFYRPSYVPHKNKYFQNCEFSGPGLVYFNRVSMNGCVFKFVQFVIVPEGGTMWGLAAFEDPKFVDCNIVNITMVINRSTYNTLPDDIKSNVPIINEQRA